MILNHTPLQVLSAVFIEQEQIWAKKCEKGSCLIYEWFHRQNNNDDDSGRSTPEHLKKYSGSAAFNDNCNGTNSAGSNSAQAAENSRRLRTFSETLKMLDDDILEELDVK